MQKIKIILFAILFLQVIPANSQGIITELDLNDTISVPKDILYKAHGFFTDEAVIVFNTNINEPKYPKGYYYWNGTIWMPAYNQPPKGSLKEDLEALYAIQNSLTNTGKNAFRPWDIDLENIDNPKNFNLSGVLIAEVYGENRVIYLNFQDFRFEDITIEKGLEAAILVNIYDNTIKSLNLTLPNLITLSIYDNNPAFGMSSELSKINLELKNAKAIMIERVRCLRELNIDAPHATSLFYTSNGCVATLDLNKMSSLKKAILEYNNFSYLKVDECKELEDVIIWNNQIKSLDFSGNPKLERLKISKGDTPNAETRLESLNISKNVNLRILNLRSVYLPNIDISNNVNLEFFQDRYSDYNSIDLTKNTKLKSFNLIYNYNISTIDLSNCNNITKVVLLDNIVEDLNLKNCNKLSYVAVDRSDRIGTLDLSASKNLTTLFYNSAGKLKNIIMCKQSPYAKDKVSDNFYTIVDCE